MIDIDFLKHLERFSLIMRKKVTSNYIGLRESELPGQGLVFRDHSLYSYGDDFRWIDWKLLARTEKLHIKRFEEERDVTVHIVMDFSASMDFGKKIKKSEYASMLALGFAYMAMRANEHFVLSTFSDNLEVFRPKKGIGQLASIYNYLNNKKPQGYSKLDDSLRKYRRWINSRSMIIIISDFLYNTEQIKDILYRFRDNDIRLVQVLDILEKRLDIEGDFNLRDSESKKLLRTFISPFVKKRYLSMLQEHNEKVERICGEVGATFYSVHTHVPLFNSLHFILTKGRRMF